jgi:hypothetical protein
MSSTELSMKSVAGGDHQSESSWAELADENGGRADKARAIERRNTAIFLDLLLRK